MHSSGTRHGHAQRASTDSCQQASRGAFGCVLPDLCWHASSRCATAHPHAALLAAQEKMTSRDPIKMGELLQSAYAKRLVNQHQVTPSFQGPAHASVVILCLRNTSSSARRVPVFLSPTAKAIMMLFTKREHLQRQQTRDWQLSWPTVKAKAVSGGTDLRCIGARYQIADCLTKHRLKEVRGSPTENSAGSTVENYCRRGHAGPT